MMFFRRFSFAVLMVSAIACSKSRSQPQHAVNNVDARLTGYWQLQNVGAAEDDGVPLRMRVYINQNNMEEIQYCSVGGAQGYTAWADGRGAHRFSIYPFIGKMTAFEGSITKVEAQALELNGKYQYTRFNPSQDLLATDATSSLCTTN